MQAGAQGGRASEQGSAGTPTRGGCWRHRERKDGGARVTERCACISGRSEYWRPFGKDDDELCRFSLLLFCVLSVGGLCSLPFYGSFCEGRGGEGVTREFAPTACMVLSFIGRSRVLYY